MNADLDPVAELQAQVQRLEQRVAALEGREAKPSAPKPERLESRLGVTIVNRAGAITLALGMLFFLKYAVDNRWIGAAGRVALGIAAGLMLVAVAERLRKRGQQVFAQGVAGCGIAILYTAFYASSAYYRLLPYPVAFGGMFAACALAVALSFRYRGAVLAALGTAGAIFAPVFLGHAFGHPRLFFSYLLPIDVAVLASALRHRWTSVHALAFSATAALFAAWSCSANANTGAGLLFLCAFFVLFFAVSLRFGAPIFFALNALWTVFSAWMLLDSDHPGWFAVFALGLAAMHFIAAWRVAHARNWLYVLGHACLLTAALRGLNIWAVNHSAPDNRASIISESTSVFVAIYAVAAMFLGVFRRSPPDRSIGLVLLAAVIGKLYCYDVWQLTPFYRISAFIALGILLLAASYVYSRFRPRSIV